MTCTHNLYEILIQTTLIFFKWNLTRYASPNLLLIVAWFPAILIYNCLLDHHPYIDIIHERKKMYTLLEHKIIFNRNINDQIDYKSNNQKISSNNVYQKFPDNAIFLAII